LGDEGRLEETSERRTVDGSTNSPRGAPSIFKVAPPWRASRTRSDEWLA